MNHIADFAVRVGSFLFTFFIIMEYVVSCKVDTKGGAIVVAIAMVSVILFFVLFRMKTIKACACCGQKS